MVISALVFGQRLGWLRQAWAHAVVIPVVCRETTLELLRVLGYPKFRLTQDERETLLENYLPFAEVFPLPIPPPPIPSPCRDPDDVIFIQLALAASVDLLVSGDSDITDLRAFPRPRIVTSNELRRLLNA